MSGSPPPTLPYKRFESGGLLRSIKRSLSRENVVGALKTLAWVGPMTILIWIYAEREQQLNLPDVPVTLEFRSNVPNAIVEPRQPSVLNFTLELEGPRKGVEDVREALYSAASTKTLPILLDSGRTPGREYTLEVARLLNNNELFVINGVSVKGASPAQVTVYIDETISKQIPVGTPSVMKNLVGTPEFDPATVKVEGPRRLIDALAPDATAVADLVPLKLAAGDHTLTSVRLLPVGTGLTLKPGVVQANVTVRNNDVTQIIPSIPIWATIPNGMAEKKIITYAFAVQNVKVVGPQEQIDLISQPEWQKQIYATVKIGDEIPYGMTKALPLTFNLPPGVSVAPDSTSPKTVDVTVTQRTTGPQ